MIRLAFLYLVIGIGIVFVQFGNSPCRFPVVLDDGGPPIGPPLDLERLGADRAYQWRLAKDVIFWLPRLVDLVGIRGMPFPDYIFGRACKGEPGSTAGAGTSAGPVQPAAPQQAAAAMPPPLAAPPAASSAGGSSGAASPAGVSLQPVSQMKPLAGYTPPSLAKVQPAATAPALPAAEPPLPPLPIERPRH